MSTAKLTEGNAYRNNSFLKSEGSQNVLQKALVSVLLFPAEECAETAVKGLAEMPHDGVLNEPAIVD